MSGDTGVTIKVDGDTTAYDAAIDRSVAKTKEIGVAAKEAHNPLKEMGGFSNEILKAMTGVAIPFGLSAGVMTAITGFIDHYHDQISKTKDILDDITKLHEKIASAGRGDASAEITAAMRKAAPMLSYSELSTVFSATTGQSGLPNATMGELVESAKFAQEAKLTAMDPGAMAKTRASLVSSGVKNADDLAYYMNRYMPDDQDNALGAIRKYPGQANDIAQAFQVAGREEGKGRKGLVQILNKTLTEYATDMQRNPTSDETFAGALAGAPGVRAAGGADGERDLQFILGQKAQPIVAGALHASAEKAEHDPLIHDAAVRARNIEDGKNLLVGEYGRAAERKKNKDARYAAIPGDTNKEGEVYSWSKIYYAVNSFLGGPDQKSKLNDQFITGGEGMFREQYDEAYAAHQNDLHQKEMRKFAETAAKAQEKALENARRRRLQSHHTQNGDR